MAVPLIIIPLTPSSYYFNLGLTLLFTCLLAPAYQKYKRHHLNSFRLQHFAEANGFRFIPKTTVADPHDTGSIFGYSEIPGVTSLGNISVVEGLYDNHAFKIGRHDNWLHKISFVVVQTYFFRIPLDASLPQIFLQGGAQARRGWSPKLTKVRGEGGIFERFNISCTPGAEAGIDTILSPELRQELLAIPVPVDIEINGPYMYLYYGDKLDLNQDIMQRFFRIMTQLTGKSFTATAGLPQAQTITRTQKAAKVIMGIVIGLVLSFVMMMVIYMALAAAA